MNRFDHLFCILRMWRQVWLWIDDKEWSEAVLAPLYLYEPSNNGRNQETFIDLMSIMNMLTLKVVCCSITTITCAWRGLGRGSNHEVET